MRNLREESLDQIVFFGEQSLRQAVRQFLKHYHVERNCQGLANRLIDPGAEVGRPTGAVQCRERLDAVFRYEPAGWAAACARAARRRMVW